MIFKKNYICFLIIVVLIFLSGCDNQNDSYEGEPVNEVTNQILDQENMFTNRDSDIEYDESNSILITLADNDIKCESSAVSISGSSVTILKGGTYIISGSLSDGQMIVNADKNDKLQLVLNGVKINSNSSAALYVQQADKVFVTLEENSCNSFSNNGSFTEVDTNKIDAVVFSKEDITFNGTGELNIQTDTENGIVSKDDLVITGGIYTISAGKHALCGKDCVKIANGNFHFTTSIDGIHSENKDDSTSGYTYIANGTFSINAQGDGIDSSNFLQIVDGIFEINCNLKAIKSTEDLIVANGTFNIHSIDDCIHSNTNISVKGGSFICTTSDDGFHADETLVISGGDIQINESYEGLEGLNIVITSGNMSIVASDDGINAGGGVDNSGFGGPRGGDKFMQNNAVNSTIKILGGIIKVNASGDGIDSNGNITVSGGEVYVSGSADNGNSALDYDGEATVTGGIVVAVGASGMAQNFSSNSTQGCMMVSFNSQSRDNIILSDNTGNVLISFTPDKYYNNVLISCPELKKGSTYSLTAGGKTLSITLTSLIYGSGNGMGGNNPSGPMGGIGRP